MLYPELVMVHYSPPKTTTPYRNTSLFPHQVPERDIIEEAVNKPRLARSLEEAWLSGARCAVLLGPWMFEAFGYTGRFLDHRGSFLEMPEDLNPSQHPWQVIPTIDPYSKAAYVRDGYATYKSDVLKAVKFLKFGSNKIVEKFTMGPDLNRILKWLKETPPGPVALDIETDALSAHSGGQMVCLGIARSIEDVCVIPFKKAHDVSYWSGQEEALLQGELVKFFSTRRIITHNGLQFDIPFMILNGLKLDPCWDYWDTMFMHKVLEPDAPHSLGHVSSKYSIRTFWKDEFKNRGGSIYKMDVIKLWTYNARDCAATWEVYSVMKKILPPTFSMSAAPLIIKKNLHQIKFSEEDRISTMKACSEAVKICEEAMENLAQLPKNFNYESPTQMNALLFGIKRILKEKKIVEENQAALAELENRIKTFDATHTTWSPGKREAEKNRFRKMVERKQGTAKYAQARDVVDTIEAIRPLCDVRRLAFKPRITADGLYSIDENARAAFTHQLERQRDKLLERLEYYRANGSQERFAEAAQSELSEVQKVLGFMKLFEARLDVKTFHDTVATGADVSKLSLEMLARFGQFIKPSFGNEFLAVFPEKMDSMFMGLLGRTLKEDQYPSLLTHKCVIIELPASAQLRVPRYCAVRSSRGDSLAAVLRGLE